MGSRSQYRSESRENYTAKHTHLSKRTRSSESESSNHAKVRRIDSEHNRGREKSNTKKKKKKDKSNKKHKKKNKKFKKSKIQIPPLTVKVPVVTTHKLQVQAATTN